MGFDIDNLHIEPDSPEGRGLQMIIDRDHVTPEEAARRALREIASQEFILRATRRNGAETPSPITDEELTRLDKMCPILGLLDDVSDETWNGIAQGSERMRQEGFVSRG